MSARRIARSLVRLAPLVALLAFCIGAAPTGPADLVLNGDFAKGAGNVPDHWRTGGWLEGPDAASYQWSHPPNGPGEIEVRNLKPNDARYIQTLTLSEGWFRFSAEIRTEGVPDGKTGASLSILEDGVMSADLHGNNDWKPEQFFVKVGRRGADVELACRLGGYASLNTGRALFRNVKAVGIAAPAVGDGPRFDLDTIRKQAAGPPAGRLWTLIATLIALAALATLGWVGFGFAESAPAVRTPAAPQPKPRKQARQQSGRGRRR